MRSSERAGLPRGWRPLSPNLGLLTVCAPVAVVVVLQAALPALGTVHWAPAGAGIAGSALLLVGAYGVARSRWRRRAIRAFGVDEKSRTTRIRYSCEIVGLRILALLMSAAMFGLVGAWSFAYQVPAAGVVMSLLSLMFLGWLVVWSVRGIRVGELSLGLDRVALTVNSRDLQADWSDVTSLSTWDATQRGAVWRRIDIMARKVTGWREPKRHEWLFDPRFSEPSIEIRCDLIDVDSVLLHDWLKFYVDNPAARVELGTPASLARAQALALAGRGGSLDD